MAIIGRHVTSITMEYLFNDNNDMMNQTETLSSLS